MARETRFGSSGVGSRGPSLAGVVFVADGSPNTLMSRCRGRLDVP